MTRTPNGYWQVSFLISLRPNASGVLAAGSEMLGPIVQQPDQ